MSVWASGGPGLHRPLDKLLGTWVSGWQFGSV